MISKSLAGRCARRLPTWLSMPPTMALPMSSSTRMRRSGTRAIRGSKSVVPGCMSMASAGSMGRKAEPVGRGAGHDPVAIGRGDLERVEKGEHLVDEHADVRAAAGQEAVAAELDEPGSEHGEGV